MAPHSLVSIGVESPGRDWEARPWHLHGGARRAVPPKPALDERSNATFANPPNGRLQSRRNPDSGGGQPELKSRRFELAISPTLQGHGARRPGGEARTPATNSKITSRTPINFHALAWIVGGLAAGVWRLVILEFVAGVRASPPVRRAP